jgi:hypothetical protein
MTHESTPAPRIRTLREQQQAEEELLMVLAHDQRAIGTERPVPRKELSRRASAALWALRIFAIVVGVMVLYAFFSQLGS